MTAFGQSLLACHAALYRYARALCRDPAEAEDLVQETFKRALAATRRPRTTTLEQVRPWAFTILRNVWRNLNRQRHREEPWEPGTEDRVDEKMESPETLLRRKLLRSEIAQAIDALPEDYREVVVLREIEGLSYADIAQVLGCPRGTVMSRLARARQLLRRYLLRLAPCPKEVEG